MASHDIGVIGLEKGRTVVGIELEAAQSNQ